jgi:RNA polymerase sigma factor (sigma-70 family)
MQGFDAGATTATLLARADAGDQAAWEELVDRFTGLLWSVARAHRLGSVDADDVVQTTWLRLVEHLDQIKEPERLASWLATTARRESLRVLGRGRREVISAVDDMEMNVADADVDSLDARLLLAERDAILWACFRQLSERCQVLLRALSATPPPSYAEVAAALDTAMGSIGPTRRRCLDQLRELLDAAGIVTAELEPSGRWGR